MPVAGKTADHPFETLANSIAQLAWIADAAGYIYWYNQRWYDYTGTNLEQMQGWGWQACHHPDHVDRVVEIIRGAFASGEAWEDTFPLRGRDGIYRWFLSRALPIRDGQGHITHWFGTNTDISENLDAQESLRANSEFLNKILESSPDCIKVLDLDGALLSMNAGGLTVMEIDDFARFKGRCWLDFWNGDSAALARAAMDEARIGRTGRFRGHAPTAKGTVRMWDVRVSPIKGRHGTPERLLSISRDITAEYAAEQVLQDLNATLERRVLERTAELEKAGADLRTEADLRAEAQKFAEQREKFARLFEQAPSFMALLRGPDHEFEFVNPAYIRLIGGREVIGRTVAEALPDVAAQGYLDLLNRAYRSGEPYAASGAQLAMQAVPGGPVSEVYIDFVYQPVRNAAGKVGGIFVEGVDVTARTLAEKARGEAEARFQTFAHAMAHHVWTSPPDGQLDWFNRQVYDYSGAATGELDGGNWAKLVHPEDLQIAAERWAAALASGKPYETEFRLRRADGVYRWHIARAVALRGTSGDILRWIGTNTDIDEQKSTAAELARLAATLEQRVAERTDDLTQANATLRNEVAQREAAEDQVRQMQKIEAIGQLTGGIAHDFNNMLAVVIGALNLIERRLDRGDYNVQSLIKGAGEGAARAAALTQRLLAFSRQQPLAPDVLDANQLIATLTDMLRRTLKESIQLESVRAGGLWKIHADHGQLESAILNLAINAQDAMEDGGKLTIETGNASLDDPYVAANLGAAAGQYVMIAVTDTGAGMAPEVAARVFEPFFTTKGVGKGTGLGLSQVYGFVKQSKGHIKIYSEVGVGTTVKVYLPRHYQDQDALERQAVEKMQATPAGAQSECILVVEDDERMGEITVAALRELGYSVLHSTSASKALRILETHPQINLLFTDVVMPEMSGRQVADKALAIRPGLPVLFTTGYTRNAIVHNGTLDAGVNFIPKPFTVDQLARKVREVLLRKPQQK